jgi:hypothetical protein
MIFGVSPTKDAVVIALATGSGETFVIKSIRSVQLDSRSGDGLNELLQRLVVIFDISRTNRGSTIALLASSSGRFKSSIEAIKGEGITQLAAAKSGLPVIKVPMHATSGEYQSVTSCCCPVTGPDFSSHFLEQSICVVVTRLPSLRGLSWQLISFPTFR